MPLKVHASKSACLGFLRRFLRDLEWVYERSVDWEGGIKSLVCVHAGLDPTLPLKDQLKALRERDMSNPVLYASDPVNVRPCECPHARLGRRVPDPDPGRYIFTLCLPL